MSESGVLVVVSGFAGAGKGTLMKKLISRYENYSLSVSATSRQPRPGEEDGVSYFFKTRDEFEEMIHNDEFLEYAEYVGNYYGTPKDWVEEQLNAGKDIVLEIELQGAFQVRKKIPEAVLIFVLPPDMEELKRRLVNRGTETMEEIDRRIQRAMEEIEFVPEYDYVIINEDVEKSVDMLHNIVRSEKNKGE